MERFQDILLVGCGNMAGAMLTGWLASGIAPGRFTVVDPARESLPEGVRLLHALPDGHFDLIVLGIKPQGLDEAAPALSALAGPRTTVMSMLAGVEFESLAARLPQAGALVRIMPNLAAAIGKSPMGLDARGLDELGRAAITDLLMPLGMPEWLEREDQFDAITALAGSGPAFVYRFIDALATGGEGLGIDPAQAQRLALAMVEGAAMLASGSPHSPGKLADMVASPGGTTRAGLDVLDADNALADVVAAALTAARDRNIEMAAAARTR